MADKRKAKNKHVGLEELSYSTMETDIKSDVSSPEDYRCFALFFLCCCCFYFYFYFISLYFFWCSKTCMILYVPFLTHKFWTYSV